MATIQVVTTWAGIVVREIFPTGERAWRLNWDGTWDYSPDHKDRWLGVIEVPQQIADAVKASGLVR